MKLYNELLMSVHPDTYNELLAYIARIQQGKRGISFYFPLLLKSIINKITK
jgi:hypothetical protein